MKPIQFTKRQLLVVLLDGPGLGRQHALMYALLREADALEAAPRVADLARALGIKERMARRQLQVLEHAGYVKRHYTDGKRTRFELLRVGDVTPVQNARSA